MKKTALVSLLVGMLFALLSYAAGEMGILDVKTCFRITFISLGLVILSAGYFMISFLVEWAREIDIFKRPS